MKASVKQRIECFQSALGKFLIDQQTYLANRKEGKREIKSKKK